MPWGIAFNIVPTGSGAAAASKAVGDNALVSHSGDSSLQIATKNGRNWFFCANSFNDPYFFGRIVDTGPIYIAGARALFGAYIASSTNERIIFEAGGVRLTNIGNSLTIRVFVNGVLQGTFVPLFDGVTEEYLEVAWKEDAAAGWVHVRINGVETFRATGLNTGNNSPTQIKFGGNYVGSNNATGTYWNDIYSIGSGASVGPPGIGVPVDDVDAPGFWGPQVVNVLTQIADVDQDWTPSTGTDNFEMVNEVPSTEDTDYVESAVIGDLDSGPVDDLPPDVNSIMMVIRQCMAKAPAGGAPQVSMGVETSDGAEDGVARSIGGTSYALAQEIFMEKPVAGGAWSVAKVNELVIRRTSA